jgi:hypothetical protein
MSDRVISYGVLGLLVIASLVIIGYMLLKETCDDPLKCYWGNMCVNIPRFYTKNYDKTCKLDCNDYDMCILNNKCITIPPGLEKDLNTNRCKNKPNYIF